MEQPPGGDLSLPGGCFCLLRQNRGSGFAGDRQKSLLPERSLWNEIMQNGKPAFTMQSGGIG